MKGFDQLHWMFQLQLARGPSSGDSWMYDLLVGLLEYILHETAFEVHLKIAIELQTLVHDLNLMFLAYWLWVVSECSSKSYMTWHLVTYRMPPLHRSDSCNLPSTYTPSEYSEDPCIQKIKGTAPQFLLFSVEWPLFTWIGIDRNSQCGALVFQVHGMFYWSPTMEAFKFSKECGKAVYFWRCLVALILTFFWNQVMF